METGHPALARVAAITLGMAVLYPLAAVAYLPNRLQLAEG